jgi:hypothetical protein
MSDRGGIQLLPETRKRIEIKTPGENRLIVIGAVIFAVVASIFFACKLYAQTLNDKLATFDKQLIDIEQKRDKDAEKMLITYNKQAALMSELLKNHIFWSRAFDKLERMTQGEIRLKSFSGSSSKGSFMVAAQAPSYSAIARQVASSLSDKGVQDVIMGGIKVGNLGVLDFSAEIMFKKEDFLKQQTP